MNDFKISVITVCYNAVNEIEKTILSVLNQTYNNIEYIIIDGGSSDGTVDIIKKYADRLAYWLSESDKGIYDAMNKGIRVATGDYINFMNAGDRFANSKVIERILSNQISFFDVIYGNWIVSEKTYDFVRAPIPLKKLKYGSCLCHQATFTKTCVLKKRPYCNEYKIAADYEYICYLDYNNFSFHYYDDVICIYSADGVSAIQSIKSLQEAKKIALKYYNPITVRVHYINSYIYTKAKIVIYNLIGKTKYNRLKKILSTNRDKIL